MTLEGQEKVKKIFETCRCCFSQYTMEEKPGILTDEHIMCVIQGVLCVCVCVCTRNWEFLKKGVLYGNQTLENKLIIRVEKIYNPSVSNGASTKKLCYVNTTDTIIVGE